VIVPSQSGSGARRPKRACFPRHQLTSVRTAGFIGIYQFVGAHMDVVHVNQKQLATRWTIS
jgi:hypothetical protein